MRNIGSGPSPSASGSAFTGISRCPRVAPRPLRRFGLGKWCGDRDDNNDSPFEDEISKRNHGDIFTGQARAKLFDKKGMLEYWKQNDGNAMYLDSEGLR